MLPGRGEGAALGHPSDTNDLPTPVCRQHSVSFLLGCRDLFAFKKKDIGYACKTYHFQWFHKHLCTMDIEQKPETLPSGVRIHSQTFPLGLCAGVPSRPLLVPPGPASRASSQAAGGGGGGGGDTRSNDPRSNAGKPICTSLRRLAPAPAGGAQGLSACLQDPPVVQGFYQFYRDFANEVFKESNLRIFLGGDVGSAPISEETNKHFEKNNDCAISKWARKKTFVEEKKNL